MNLKFKIKNNAGRFFAYTGFFNFLNASFFKYSGLILMYHRIVGKQCKEKIFIQPGMYVSQYVFRQHVEFINNNYNIIPLIELFRRLESGRKIGGCCAITFDDGWQDNYSQAYPTLKEFNIPATIFLATGFIGTNRWFWPDEVGFILQSLETHGQEYDHPFLSSILKDRSVSLEEKIDHVIIKLKELAPNKREEVLGNLRALSPTEISSRALLMNWDEVVEMASDGLIDFGAHSHSHVILDQVPPAQAEMEIRQSRLELEDRLGRPPLLFAYPNGNFTTQIQEHVRKQGFKGAVSTRKGWVDKHSDLFALPRIGIHEDISSTLPLFQARILCRGF